MRPVRVGQELDLDVAGRLQPAFEEHLVVAEGGPGLAAGRGDGLGQVARVADDPHADAAAAVGRLDQQGEPDLGGGVGGQAGPTGPGTGRAGRTGTPAPAATRRASSLSPRAASTLGGGPTQRRPAASTASANEARSDRNP